jgi:3-mercaptopyruvate sulfurtransferase SseA
MNKKYIFLAVLLIVMAAGILILPPKQNLSQSNPEDLMLDVMQPTRYFSTDQVAQLIIENDPTLQLVDVRSVNEFNAFSLPGSINIPVDSLLSEYSSEYLSENGKIFVFYDNDDILSDQVWVLAKRLGHENIYVLTGGLNRWINTIIRPQEPDETASSDEFDLFTFRKGASMYFTGAKIEQADVKTEVKMSRKKKSGGAEGGC